MHVRANSGNPYLRLSRGFCGGKGNLLWREFEDALEEEEMVVMEDAGDAGSRGDGGYGGGGGGGAVGGDGGDGG